MKLISSGEFDAYWKALPPPSLDEEANRIAGEIISAVRNEGDAALRRYASRFDKSSPSHLEVPFALAEEARTALEKDDRALLDALTLAAGNIRYFALKQKAQFREFEYECAPGILAGQKVIPVEKAAVYVPAGRFPLISSALMGLVPALSAGTGEVILASPPLEDGLPDRRILAAAAIAASVCRTMHDGTTPNAASACDTASTTPADPTNSTAPTPRIFAMGGAQAIAALALGTESVPRVDLIVGPGNKYIAAAKRLLAGEVGIDFIAGPTDVLVIADTSEATDAALIAADLLAQAEHDADARARLLVPDQVLAAKVMAELERQLAALDDAATARQSLDSGGLIVVYNTTEEALRIANTIAPEHLELQLKDTARWIPHLRNFGSLFIGKEAAEVLGDYSAGINHTLPTSGSARYSGGLSVRHFLKTPTTLRAAAGSEPVRNAAEIIARAEGLKAHAASARMRAAEK
ncbi:MAG: histidinol dehydrogenase [Spirochaetaceae bacterium]|jgi:histidinol dehydrogenase|nr:histidinol dehydrogenase [Spirochaetaceae bacterium]